MYRNYLRTALGHVFKNRLFTAINVFGLAIGLMSCILIMLFVREELSYDTFVPGGEQVVRLHSAYYQPGRPPFETVRSAGRMKDAIVTYASAEVEAGVRLFFNGTTIIRDADAFTETMTFADVSFFDVLALPFVHGSAETSFRNNNDFVITEEIALKYFGRTDVVGETLISCCLGPESTALKITGVIKDIPEASHLNIDMLIVMDPAIFAPFPNILDTWTSMNVYTYFKLREGATAEQLQERVITWLDTESIFVGDERIPGKPSEFSKPRIMEFEDIHLSAREHAGSIGDMGPMGDQRLVTTFIAVAILILVIASINFMNLSTAKAANRAREVALRKVMGATRTQVALQFLSEAVAIAFTALVFAIVSVELVLPIYNAAIGKQLELNLLSDLPLLATLMGGAVLTGLISGSYPALYLSRFLPARILGSNKSSDGAGQVSFRSALVVFQFAISIGLVICTAVVYGQTVYARTMDLGYNTQGKLALTNLGTVQTPEKLEAIRSALSKISSVSSVTLSSEVPSQDNQNNTGFRLLGGEDAEANADNTNLNIYTTGFGFFEAYGIKPIAGRTFDKTFGADQIIPIPEGEDRIGSASVVLNESAVSMLGIGSPDQAIGKVVRGNAFSGAGTFDFTIVGVVPDVYFRSVKFGVRASVYWVLPSRYRVATISFETNDVAGVISDVERVWKEHMPLTPIAHQFVSDMVAAQYDQENRQAELFAAFSALAVLVACLGLFGLASFSAEQRTKEIGIRKVLGATIRDIVQLLVWQFSRPVLVANIIAWPVAWYFMSDWLEGFRYSLGDSYILMVAVAAGTIALLIAWITVAGRAYSVAQTNPISALRYE